MGGTWKTPVEGHQDYLRLDHPDVGVWAGTNDGGIEYGLDLQTGPDQRAKLQAALDHAGRNGVPSTILIAGWFAADGKVTPPTDVQVNWLGTGTGDGVESPAGILFRTDSGPNPEDPAAEYAIKTTKDHTVWMQGFTIAGPGFGGGFQYGSWPSHLSGVYLEGACVLRDMRIFGFGAAIGANNDHHYFGNCNLQGNGYAINFVNNPNGGLGDETFLKCQFTNQTRASIAICDTNTIANARFGDNGHNGGAPYSIYRYSNKDGVTGNATGSAASPALTSVAISSRVPGVGSRVSGTNITWGTKVVGVSGSSGNYTVTLSANPTGTVASVTIYQAPRGTVMAGVVFENWSHEAVGNSVFVDEPNWEYDSPGGWTHVVFDPPADVSSFGAQELRWTQYVTCTGVSGASQLTAVALSDWRPLVGDSAENLWTFPETATPLQLDTTITSVDGTTGNWTIGLSKPLVANATHVRIGKPIRRVAYDLGDVSGFHWRDGPLPFVLAETPSRFIPYLMTAHTIFDISADFVSVGNFGDFPSTRIFKAYTGPALTATAPGEHSLVLDGILLGVGSPGTGRMVATARVVYQNIAKGQVVQVHSYSTCEPWANSSSSMYSGIAVTDFVAGEVAIMLLGGANSDCKVLNSSGLSIPNGTLLKPHSSGGGVAAAAVSDSPIIGRVHDGAIAAGDLGAARLHIP